MQIYSLRPSPASSLEVDCELLRTLKPHTTPVVVLAVDRTGTLLATGGADGVIKVWDIAGGYVTHTFRGPNVLVSALHFFELVESNRGEDGANNRKKERRKSKDIGESDGNETARGFRLASGSQDGKVRIWNLYKRKCVSTLDSHVSDVRALDYSPEENALLTASRDRTMTMWNAKSWKARKVIPVLEEIEVAGFLSEGKHAFTGGANGHIRVWQPDLAREITESEAACVETDAIVDAIHIPSQDVILVVRAGHTLSFYSTSAVRDFRPDTLLPALPELRRISGTHDEIIDLGYLSPDHSLMALATNSEELRIVSLQEDGAASYFGADIAQLKGHEDIIICLSIDWSGHWIATGAKDNSARLWRVDPANNTYTCYTTFTGHAESIGAIALPHLVPQDSAAAFKTPLDHPPPYLMTGSQDQTIKRWDIPQTPSKDAKPPRALYTRKAHDKDINALDISPDSQLFASASQDRLVKIWSTESGETIGILRGHRRGVWSAKFAPKDTPSITGEEGASAKGKGLLLTGSGDKTIKIWSLSTFTCLRTFEGHTTSVLKVCWLNTPISTNQSTKRLVQVASAGGDGLVKVWDATTGEVACTLDNHTDRVWALAIHPKTNTIVSGGGDSIVTFWKDTTTSTAAEATAKATAFVEQEQKLQNHIYAGQWREGIVLALQLNHPARLLALFTNVIEGEQEVSSLSGNREVDEVLASLSDEQIFTLLLRIRDWNTNARSAVVAQRVLYVLVRSYGMGRLAGLKGRKGAGLGEVLDGLRGYTERHYRRVEELADESWIVEYTLGEMDGLVGEVGALNGHHSEGGDGDVVMV